MARLDTGRGRPPQRTRLAVVADDDHYTTVDAALCAPVDIRLKRRIFVAQHSDSQHSTCTQRQASGSCLRSQGVGDGMLAIISGFGYASGGTRQELSGIRMEVERPKVFAALKLWTA